MPFDGLAAVGVKLVRLEALLAVLPKSTGQRDYRTCLLSEAVKHPGLRRAGLLSLLHFETHDGPFWVIANDAAVARFFGISVEQVNILFGNANKTAKEIVLNAIIEHTTC